MDILKGIIENESIREALKAEIKNTLEVMAIERVFSGKTVEGYYEAQHVIEKVFNNLEGKYGKQSRSTQDPR